LGLKGAEQVLLFDAFFIAVLSLYGVNVGSGPNLQTFQTIPQPKLAPLPADVNCSTIDPLCNSTKDITHATAMIGWAIVNLPVIGVYFIIEMIVFLDMVLSIAFSPSFSPNGVPVLGFLFTAMQIIVIFEVFRIFRGSSSGL